MKIVHVYHHYWPIVGGLENVVKALAEEMAKLGHEVHVVTSTYGAVDRPREEVVNGVYVHRVKALRLIYPDLTYPLKYPTSILKDADVVHAHSQNSLFTVKIIEKAKKLDVKTVIHLMAIDAFDDHPNLLIRHTAPFYGKWILQKAIKASDIRLVKSRKDKETLKRVYNIDTIYVPDGIPDELLKKPNMAREFMDKYKIIDPFIVYIGRLHKLKGVDILIKAMSIATRDLPELKAVIIGPGDQRPFRDLARRLGVEKSIMFLGFVDESTKIGALDASIALVLPSICNYVEAFSLAITEAWARHKPVIATAIGEIPYRVKHMVNGLLVPPKNSRAIAEAIVRIASDKNLAARLGSEGRKNIYSWSEIVNKLISIYESSCKLRT